MKDYTPTLNLPKTDFPMKAGLPQREPLMLEGFAQGKIYDKMVEKNKNCPPFLLHDGPPFSNGNIHIGHAMNKLLKDLICKSRAMSGYSVRYIPGYDNHGLPIESAIAKQSGVDRNKMSVAEFRTRCAEFAQNYVDLQTEQFQRLGVFGEWDNAYRTMTPDFEAAEVEVFGKMYEQGYITKGLKPVYWCPSDQTALAEAEIEYADEECYSAYVAFAVSEASSALAKLCEQHNAAPSFLIWTTTPWTLPGNLAITLHPRVEYALIVAGGKHFITAADLAGATMEAGGVADYTILGTLTGADIEGTLARHPFLPRDSRLICADFVTTTSGTGCVHTAPGFGADDYVACRRYGIDVIVPVDDRGIQTEEAGPFAGMHYSKSNAAIIEYLEQSGGLFAHAKMNHSYPHCWRCKKPVIYRATPQWFCSVEAFRDKAAEAVDKVEFIPPWGKERMQSMLAERGEWCISRQRVWGLPIPVFYCENQDCPPICTPETIAKVCEIFAQRGSNAWFDDRATDLLPAGFACPTCGGSAFTKETDTLDCWFDSGVTFYALKKQYPELSWPCDVYIEGPDQYRGWFQSSLLTNIAAGMGAPYKAVITHGWTLDGQGRAMHKSLGNVIPPADIIKNYGAELLRVWVASVDYQSDVRISDGAMKQLSESYRKIRNTFRILLANLGDFDARVNSVAYADMPEVDRWALAELNELIREVREAYDDYRFHTAFHKILSFCTIEMSNLYIDIVKDRVYVEGKDSTLRRSAQTVMYAVLTALLPLSAPILTFTAEEAWGYLPHKSVESVFLVDMPEIDIDTTAPQGLENVKKYNVPGCEKFEKRVERTLFLYRWKSLFAIRDDVAKALEIARESKLIGKSLEAKVTLYPTEEQRELLASCDGILSDLFIVSHTHISMHAATAPADAFTADSGLAVHVAPADGVKCERCWIHTTDTVDDEGTTICKRCAGVIGVE